MDFKIEIDASIDDEEAHLMQFAHDTIQRVLRGTKIRVNNITITNAEQGNT